MDTRIESALAQMEQHLAEPLSIATLAAGVNLSPSRFAHLFRREVGASPVRYLHVLRMLRARLLLERTFLSVKEVMALVGCNDPSHFSRDFRSFHGAAPRSVRLGASRTVAPEEVRGTAFEGSAAVTEIAALANERRNPPRKPRPRARAPDVPLQTQRRRTETRRTELKESGNDTSQNGIRLHSPHGALDDRTRRRPGPVTWHRHPRRQHRFGSGLHWRLHAAAFYPD